MTDGTLRQDSTAAGIVSGLTQFSVSLFRAVSKKLGPGENVLLSPFHVAAGLSMILVGTQGNTAAQIKHGLHVNGFTDEQIVNEIGKLIHTIVSNNREGNLWGINQLFVDCETPLKDSFQLSMKEHFGCPAQQVDFEMNKSAIAINNWVKEVTRHKINQLFPVGFLGTSTKLILASAVYFKGKWMHPFDPARTEKRPFYLGSSYRVIDVPMMRIAACHFRAASVEKLDSSALELPYEGRDKSMFIILPNRLNGLVDLESKLTGELVESLDGLLKEQQFNSVTIPKFQFGVNVTIMKEALAKLGMKDMFNHQLAELSGISEASLHLSDVVHKSYIEVDEGDKAPETTADSTGSALERDCLLRSNDFTVDHPALFFIRDNCSKLILFVGRLVEPDKAV